MTEKLYPRERVERGKQKYFAAIERGDPQDHVDDLRVGLHLLIEAHLIETGLVHEAGHA